MTHVELSLSQPGLAGGQHGPTRPGRADAPAQDPLGSWAVAVAAAWEPCMLLNDEGVVVAASTGCRRFLLVPPGEAVGRKLLDGVLRLLDFSYAQVPNDLAGSEREKIPPLVALSNGVLARGLLRVPLEDETIVTLDAITTPIHREQDVVGSLTFFSFINR